MSKQIVQSKISKKSAVWQRYGGINNADDLMALVEEVKKTRQHDLTIEDVESYAAAYQALQEDKTKAIALNSTFEDTVASVDADYAKN